MKSVEKLILDNFELDNFLLIAIISTLEDYRLAYAINKIMETKFVREEKDVEVKTTTANFLFSNFTYQDDADCIWRLIANKAIAPSKEQNKSDLFDNYTTTYYLLPEYKKVDYWLKIENIDDFFSEDEILENIKNIKNISMTYIVEKNSVKSIENLFL